jgi:hypothetical protein
MDGLAEESQLAALMEQHALLPVLELDGATSDTQ